MPTLQPSLIQQLNDAFRTTFTVDHIIRFIRRHGNKEATVEHIYREAGISHATVYVWKKPLVATDAEQAVNPRSRSAKLHGFVFT